MAQGFAEKYGIKSSSAGTLPSSRINPTVVEVMKEKGIDISNAKPKMLTLEMIEEASMVVTMGCSVEQVCPKPILIEMEKKLIDWKLEDPEGKPIEKVRMIRDEIERLVVGLSMVMEQTYS
jgi:arsenate reductase (thioredoxin)